MRKVFLLLALFTFTHVAYTQTKVSGMVKDNKGKPVSGASITLKDTYDGAVSDSTGKYSFQTTEKGQFILVVSAIGYKGIEQPLNLAGGSMDVPLVLKEEINEMKAVVITAGSFEASDRKRAAVVLDPIDIVTTASANGDVTQALKTLPGAQQVGESEGLFVRGGTAAETNIFIDGTLVNKFFFSSGPNIAGYGRFSPFLFKGTVFSTGGYSALYGQALSSAVILESIDLPEQTSASLGISMLSLSAGFQHLNQKKTASWGFSGAYTNLGPAFAVLKQKQDYFQVPSIFNGEGNFRIKTSSSGMLKYYGTLSTNKLGFTTPSLDSAGYFDKFSLDNINIYHNLSWKERIGNYWKLAAGISYTNNRDEIAGAMRDGGGKDVTLGGLEFKNFRLKPTGNYTNAKLVLERRLSGLSAIRFGSEYNHTNDRTVFTDNNNNRYQETLKETVTSLFAESDIYLTNALAAKVGTRLERSAYLDRFNIAPRLSLAYKLGDNSQASLAYGIFYQNPESRYLPSTAGLDFSKATHYIAQYQKVGSQRVFRAEVFYKKYDQLIKTGFANGRDGIAINNNGFGDAKGF